MTPDHSSRSSRTWWALVILVLAGVALAYAVSHRQHSTVTLSGPDPRLPLPDFRFTERSGQTVTRDSLRGSVWIADFIFTSCAGPCPEMTRLMTELQHDLRAVRDLKLVSLTVDPERDTPEVLRRYADRFGADPQRWLFLTGSLERTYDLAIAGFKIAVEQARVNQEIIHDTRFILVDARSRIRGYYDSADPAALARLRRDARTLAGAPQP